MAPVNLFDLCQPKQWPTLSKLEMSSNGFPVFGANGQIGYSESFTHADPVILIGCRGSCGTVHITPPKAYANGNAMALDNLRSDRVDLRYLYHFLQSRGFADVTAGSSQPQITQTTLRRVDIPIPFPDDPRRSLAEQKRIAAILDKADAIRRRRQSVPQQYRDLIVSRFDEAFGDPIRNTRGFPTKPLEELVGSERPISYGILMPGPDTPGGVPYVRVAEMRDERLILESIRRTTPEIHAQYRRSTIRPGDIMLSIRGHVGRLAMVPKALDGGNITQDTARLAIKDPDLAVYVFWLLDSPYTQRWMQGYVRGVAVKGINLGDVKRLPIMLPSPKAITQFAKFARTAFDAQNEAIAVTRHADELFNAIMQRAFRGEL